jgi:hypothetical protein
MRDRIDYHDSAFITPTLSNIQNINDKVTPVIAANALPLSGTDPILMLAPLTPVTNVTAPRTMLIAFRNGKISLPDLVD